MDEPARAILSSTREGGALPILIVLGLIVVILGVRIIIGLFTRPVDTIQMLGSWICTAIGILGLWIAGMLLWAGRYGNAKLDAGDKTILVGSAIVGIAALVLSGWLKKRRLRNLYKLHIEAEASAYDAVMRRRSARR